MNYDAWWLIIQQDSVDGFAQSIPLLTPDDRDWLAAAIVGTGARNILRYWLERDFPLSATELGSNIATVAASGGRPDILRLLIDHGASLSGVPLVAAAYAGSLECVKLLVEAGADVNVGHKGFPTPLSTAIAFKHNDIEAYLRAHGATKLVGEGAPE